MSYFKSETGTGTALGEVEIMNQLHMAEVHHAVMSNDWSQVENILFQNPSVAKEYDAFNGQTILHKLCKEEKTPIFTLEMLVLLNPMALAHRDLFGSLPIHYACQYGSQDAVSIIVESYKVSTVERNRGRLPIHIAAQHNQLAVVQYLVEMDQSTLNDRVQKYTSTKEGLKPTGPRIPKIGTKVSTSHQVSGGLPLHYACRNHRGHKIISYLLKQNPYAAAMSDDSGEFPLHIFLRTQGSQTDLMTLKELLEASAAVTSIRDKIGNFPLATAMIRMCSEPVIHVLLDTFPLAACERDRHSKLPIELATEQTRSLQLVMKLLLSDMPIDMEDHTYLTIKTHGGSWHYILSYQDLYFPVVERVLKECSYTQVRGLSEAKDRYGNMAKDIATPICLHLLKFAMRMCHGTLQIVDWNPAFKNLTSETEIYYGMKFINDRLEKELPSWPRQDNEDPFQFEKSLTRLLLKADVSKKLTDIGQELCEKVLLKGTTNHEIFQRDLWVRQEYGLSSQYIAKVIATYPSLDLNLGPCIRKEVHCIVMECADATLENMLPTLTSMSLNETIEILYSIATPLDYLHRQHIIHGDFGCHNVGRFGDQFKLLGVGGCIKHGAFTDINRGFYLPPEAVQVDKKSFVKSIISNKPIKCRVLSVQAHPSFDIWAFGCIMFELLTGRELPLYSKNGFKWQRLEKIESFTTKKLFKEINDSKKTIHPQLIQLLAMILEPNPNLRIQSMEGIMFRLEGIVGEHVKIGIVEGDVLPLQCLSLELSESVSPVSSVEFDEEEEDTRSIRSLTKKVFPIQEARNHYVSMA